MATSDGRLRIAFNGEIYNFRELRSELEAKGYRFRSKSDTEVLLHLYADRGEDMVDVLRGMYAFVIWDEQRGGVFLARDPFGIKPLYYADDGNTVRVASQVKALLKGGGVDSAPEPAGHVGFFLWGHVPEPYTLYKRIRALEAGTSLWIDSIGSRKSRQFFSITDELAKADRMQLELSTEAMHERLRAVLLDSVRYHMIADVPIGVFLSAGLDSTTLTALALETGCMDLRTITLGFKEFVGTANDEVPLANEVARHYGTRHETKWVTKRDFQDERERLLQAMDQPSTDGINSYFVSKAAASAGLKVALSGLGADELFGGYPSFRQIPLMVAGLSAFQAVPRVGRGFRMVAAPILRQFTSPKAAGLLEYGGTYEGAYLLRRGMYMPWELTGILDGEMVREGWRELNTLSLLHRTMSEIDRAPLKVTALESTWYMRNQLLRDTDWAGMAHSLEIRTPFVDVDLFRAVAPMICGIGAFGKLKMAATPRKLLPQRVLSRKKTGFVVPVKEWFAAGQGPKTDRGQSRGWAKYLYGGFVEKPLRVLVLVTDAFGGRGGIAKFNRDLLTALANDANVSGVTVLPRLMPDQAGEVPGKVIYRVDATGGKLRFVGTVVSLLLRKRRNFDLVICGHINLMAMGYLAKALMRVPVVLVGHGVDVWRPIRSIFLNFLAKRVDGFISVSEFTKMRFIEWSGVSPKRVWILPNSFEPSQFSIGAKDEALLARYGLQGRTVLLTMGRLASEERAKGFDQVLQVLPGLRSRIPNVAYLIVGDGNDRARLEAKVRQLGLDDSVVFSGYIQESEKAAHYRLADVYVMPSRFEGFGIVYLEAMACGIPTVGSAVDGSREALMGGALGLLIDPDDPIAIRRAIIEALNRPRGAPAGLDYFSYANFEVRLRAIMFDIRRALRQSSPIRSSQVVAPGTPHQAIRHAS